MLLPRSEISLSFSLKDKTSAPDAFSSSSFIPRANFKKSLVMVTFYGYEIRRRVGAGGQAIFQQKCMFYQLLSTIKVKLVEKLMLSAYLCVNLHVKRIKLAFIAVLT